MAYSALYPCETTDDVELDQIKKTLEEDKEKERKRHEASLKKTKLFVAPCGETKIPIENLKRGLYYIASGYSISPESSIWYDKEKEKENRVKLVNLFTTLIMLANRNIAPYEPILCGHQKREYFPTDAASWQNVNEIVLAQCAGIIVFNFQHHHLHSKGVQAEIAFAQQHDIPVYHYCISDTNTHYDSVPVMVGMWRDAMHVDKSTDCTTLNFRKYVETKVLAHTQLKRCKAAEENEETLSSSAS